jgi:hypothetical protein
VGFFLPPCAALPGRRERPCLYFSPLPVSVFSLLSCCFWLVFLSLFVGRLVLFSVAAVHLVVISAQFSSAFAQSGSFLVLRWVFLKTRSTLLRKTRAYTRHPIVITGPPASQRRRPIIHQHRTLRSVSFTRLSVDLTCRSVYTTPRAFYLSTATTGLLAPLRLHSTHLLLCRSVCSAVFFGRRRSLVFAFVVFLQLCLCCIFAVLLLSCVSQLCLCCNFCVFSFILLSVMLYLPAMTWFDLEVEIVLWVLASFWFFAVPTLQLSFYSDGCFTCIGLFSEFLCNLYRLVRLWNRPGLPLVLFGLLVITIASSSVLMDRIQYLFLYLHCFLSFGLCC